MPADRQQPQSLLLAWRLAHAASKLQCTELCRPYSAQLFTAALRERVELADSVRQRFCGQCYVLLPSGFRNPPGWPHLMAPCWRTGS